MTMTLTLILSEGAVHGDADRQGLATEAGNLFAVGRDRDLDDDRACGVNGLVRHVSSGLLLNGDGNRTARGLRDDGCQCVVGDACRASP